MTSADVMTELIAFFSSKPDTSCSLVPRNKKSNFFCNMKSEGAITEGKIDWKEEEAEEGERDSCSPPSDNKKNKKREGSFCCCYTPLFTVPKPNPLLVCGGLCGVSGLVVFFSSLRKCN